ncbi:L-alanine exporter AlaE [Pseudomonas sp. NPDC087639]|uniref:L-alanine exporter AlaE n=1 Tax=Pseudomonas sp. NPDC087639 TaxID=3364445 RepID=UPI0037F435F3
MKTKQWCIERNERGASGDGLVRGTLGAALMMLFLGRPYGAFLNVVRKLFGLPPGGDKPMSLNS